MTGRSTKKLTITHSSGDTVDLNVIYDWWYDPGVRYYPDGSGQPPDGGAEVVSYDEVDGDPLPEWLTDDMVQDALDVADFD